jgi:hypothetical protein
MKILLTFLLGSVLLLAMGTAAQAQSPYSRPTVTPYLNLYRGGASPALNYLNLVRPEIDLRAGLRQLQQLGATNQQAITDLTTVSGLPATGHAAGFMTQRSYFQTQGAFQTQGTSGATGSNAARRPPASGIR